MKIRRSWILLEIEFYRHGVMLGGMCGVYVLERAAHVLVQVWMIFQHVTLPLDPVIVFVLCVAVVFFHVQADSHLYFQESLVVILIK
jgi:hypothetical protein